MDTTTASNRPRRHVWTALVPIAALLAGVLFASTATTARGGDLRPASATQVADLVAAEQRRVEAYDAQARALRAQVQAASARAATRPGQPRRPGRTPARRAGGRERTLG